jgi:hypothetical protein
LWLGSVLKINFDTHAAGYGFDQSHEARRRLLPTQPVFHQILLVVYWVSDFRYVIDGEFAVFIIKAKYPDDPAIMMHLELAFACSNLYCISIEVRLPCFR